MCSHLKFQLGFINYKCVRNPEFQEIGRIKAALLSASGVTNSAISADNPDPVIVCDTREQEPLVFTRLRSVRGTLTTGDYGILGAEHAGLDFVIEVGLLHCRYVEN